MSLIYIHRPRHDEPELIEISETLTVQELIEIHGQDGDSVWIEDGEEIVSETVVVEVVKERGHIHIGRCREIAVVVRYGGDEKPYPFPPGTTIHSVFEWAAGEHGFGLPPAQRPAHGLFVPGSQTPLDSAQHVGALAHECGLILDLAPKHRAQG
jgi:hypothetical protein